MRGWQGIPPITFPKICILVPVLDREMHVWIKKLKDMGEERREAEVLKKAADGLRGKQLKAVVNRDSGSVEIDLNRSRP